VSFDLHQGRKHDLALGLGHEGQSHIRANGGSRLARRILKQVRARASAVNAEGFREILGICEAAKEDKSGEKRRAQVR